MLAYVLTLGRLVLAGGFAVGVALAARAGGPNPPGAGSLAALLVLAGLAELTDLLDGIAARRRGTVTSLGGLLDPLCDSLSRLTMYFAAALAGWVWVGVPLAMVGRDVVVAYVRTVRATVGWATRARKSGKVKAIAQGAGLIALVCLSAGGQARWADTGRLIVGGCVLAVTIWSLLDYLRGGWGAITRLHRAGPEN